MKGLVWCLLLMPLLSLGDQAASKPNIIVIVADDLGWADVSFHGSTQISTPNLDALAYDGVMLTDYYVEQICTPSRAALLTGRYPEHLGLQHSVIFGSMAYGLGLNETLLPQHLRRAGYATHMIGKWHLGFVAKEYTPPYRGFDTFFGFIGGKDDYWDHTRQEGPDNAWGFDFYEDSRPKKDVFGRYSTDLYTERAARLIRDHDVAKPFFLYYPQQAPHNANGYRPEEAPDKCMRRFQHIADMGRRTYLAMVSCLDDSVGNLTMELHAKGMLNNSLIVFSTDNGGPAHGFSANHAANFPLRGMKYTRWEGGVRGTAFVWSPRLAPRVSARLMHVTDWLPTLLAAAGAEPDDNGQRGASRPPLDGVDQWRALLSAESASAREEVLLGIDPLDAVGSYALRAGRYKVIWSFRERDGWYRPEGEMTDDAPSSPQSSPRLSLAAQALRAIGRGQQTPRPFTFHCGPPPVNASIDCVPNKKPCLFDVVSDPCEHHNLAEMQPALLSSLLDRVSHYKSTMVPPRNKPYDPAGNPRRHGGIWQPWKTLDEIPMDEW